MTAKLIYFATPSLDGYVEDAQCKIDFAAQDEANEGFDRRVVFLLARYGTHSSVRPCGEGTR